MHDTSTNVKKYLHRIFLAGIISFGIVNSAIVIQRAYNAVSQLPQIYQMNPPGSRFVSLRPYLKDIAYAGFYCDISSENTMFDTRIMALYQGAQFCLSPTLLDFFKAMDYEYIVFDCSSEDSAASKMKAIGAIPIVQFPNGVSLVRRIKQ